MGCDVTVEPGATMLLEESPPRAAMIKSANAPAPIKSTSAAARTFQKLSRAPKNALDRNPVDCFGGSTVHSRSSVSVVVHDFGGRACSELGDGFPRKSAEARFG